jgi:hypothetical protein
MFLRNTHTQADHTTRTDTTQFRDYSYSTRGDGLVFTGKSTTTSELTATSETSAATARSRGPAERRLRRCAYRWMKSLTHQLLCQLLGLGDLNLGVDRHTSVFDRINAGGLHCAVQHLELDRRVVRARVHKHWEWDFWRAAIEVVVSDRQDNSEHRRMGRGICKAEIRGCTDALHIYGRTGGCDIHTRALHTYIHTYMYIYTYIHAKYMYISLMYIYNMYVRTYTTMQYTFAQKLFFLSTTM